MTSYRVAFLSPEPVTIYLSSDEMSQQRTDEDSLDYKENRNKPFNLLINAHLLHNEARHI